MKIKFASLYTISSTLGFTLSQTHPQCFPCDEQFFKIDENTAKKDL